MCGCQSLVSLLRNAAADALSMQKRNPWFVAFASNKNIGELGSKVFAFGICYMNCVKRTGVSLSVGDHINLLQGSTSGHHTCYQCQRDETSNLASIPVSLNVVIHFGQGVRVADGLSIMGY